MTAKQLYQLDWSGGQTDGDQTRNTAKQLLNVELEEFGRLRTRDSLIAFAMIDSTGNSAYMSHNPAKNYEIESWLAFTHDGGLRLYGIDALSGIATTVMLDAGVTGIDPVKSEIAVYGDKFFMSAVDIDGEPLGAFIVFSPETTDRFNAPHAAVGTDFDVQTEIGGGNWELQPIKMLVPELHAEAIAITEMAGIANANFSSKHDNRTELNQIRERVIDGIGSSLSNGVGIIAVHSYADNDTPIDEDQAAPEGVYGHKPTVDLKVQYVFHGGQVSQLSEPVSVSPAKESYMDDDTPSRFSFGYLVMAPIGISPSVKGINIYRKIVDSGNEEVSADSSFYFIGTAWIDGNSIGDHQFVGNTEIVTNHQDNSDDDDGIYVGFRMHALKTDPSATPRYSNFVIGSSRITLTGDMYKSRGWLAVGSGIVQYCAEHYGTINGRYTYSLTRPNDYYHARYMGCSFTGKFMSTRYGTGSYLSTTMMRFGADFPENFLYEDGPTGTVLGTMMRSYLTSPTNYGNNYGAELQPDIIAGLDIVLDSSSAYGIHGGTGDYEFLWYSTVGKDAPFVMFRDDGSGTTDTEASFNGIVAEDLVDHKPLHIAVAGGRLLCLGGIHDGSNRPTRSWYSQYQKFSMFDKNSFLDYGARDDGIGIGLSAFRGTALFHFSSATYIVDVSGGFDMSWRELGAYTNIGLLHSRALAETPLGVFWGDKNDVYWFNGKSVEKVSHIDNARRTIRDSYRAMVRAGSDDIRFNYRSDLRQVWVSSGSTVYVLDIDGMAWHEHDIEEFADLNITNIFDIDGDQFLVVEGVTAGQPSGQSGILKASRTAVPAFDWGFEFEYNAGAPEVIKKAKRFYIDVDGTGQFTVVATGDDGSVITQRVKAKNKMIRFSASVKGRNISLNVNTGGERWRGMIDSVGMSHKVKPIK